ncbi:hypothetical protein MJO28_005789 [Puccinia striiformis f. sp. tritici]|uniref:Uncharacterized protein n=1 Tax=Puccinia striiformis f. sp. tritici TaxID=168172 RepID=A0ACC0EMQ4_9BASI|nr:hypothetical protein MJO28_005789 [Puccinia striiformis f. sp. tritici]
MDETDRDGGCRHKGLWAADRRQYRVIDNGAAERTVEGQIHNSKGRLSATVWAIDRRLSGMMVDGM